MTGIKIYVEGGDIESRAAKASLRHGLDGLLGKQKKAAQKKRLHWDVVFCGNRNDAKDAFKIAFFDSDRVTALLVDSEAGLSKETGVPSEDARTRWEHLRDRDGWKDLPPNAAAQVHLMVQTMETWICADAEALKTYYGQGFHPNRLPARRNLEEEPKQTLTEGLKGATKNSQKGEYHKIRHASDLLSKIRPEVVASRCPRFATFTSWLDQLIESLPASR